MDAERIATVRVACKVLFWTMTKHVDACRKVEAAFEAAHDKTTGIDYHTALDAQTLALGAYHEAASLFDRITRDCGDDLDARTIVLIAFDVVCE